MLVDGPHVAKVVVTDAVGNPNEVSWTFQTDRTSPQLTTDGPLVHVEDQALTDPSYALTVTATDGDAVHPNSGVRSITVWVDDRAAFYAEQSCPYGNCSMTSNYVYR